MERVVVTLSITPLRAHNFVASRNPPPSLTLNKTHNKKHPRKKQMETSCDSSEFTCPVNYTYDSCISSILRETNSMSDEDCSNECTNFAELNVSSDEIVASVVAETSTGDDGYYECKCTVGKCKPE